MSNLILAVILLVCSLFYTWKPKWFLRRKYLYEDIPDTSVRVARAVGALLSVLFAAGVIYSIYIMVTG